jgi:hypothetical protein
MECDNIIVTLDNLSGLFLLFHCQCKYILCLMYIVQSLLKIVTLYQLNKIEENNRLSPGRQRSLLKMFFLYFAFVIVFFYRKLYCLLENQTLKMISEQDNIIDQIAFGGH